MGQTMTSETLSISGSDGYYYCVGLQAKPIHRGYKKTVYKGVLLGSGPRQWEKVVAKSFTDIPGAKEYWSDEVNKSAVTKQLTLKFAENCSLQLKIKVVIPGLVQMDKVSKINRWLEHWHGYRSLDKDDWISIEEYVPGDVYRFCPWTEGHISDDSYVMTSKHLQTFSHFTYKETNCELVICDFQGVFENNTYILTDSIIHSRFYNHGRFDEGEYGITEFFKRHKCSDICKDWQKSLPLAPTSQFDDPVESSKQVRFDLSPFENVVFPSERSNMTSENEALRQRCSSDQNAQKDIEANENYINTQKGEELHKNLHRIRAASQSAVQVDRFHDELHSRSRALSDSGQHLTRLVKIIDTKSPCHEEEIGNIRASQRRSCLKRSFRDQKATLTANEFPLSPKIDFLKSEEKGMHGKEQNIVSQESSKKDNSLILSFVSTPECGDVFTTDKDHTHQDNIKSSNTI